MIDEQSSRCLPRDNGRLLEKRSGSLTAWVLAICLLAGCSTLRLPGLSSIHHDPPKRSQATHQFRKPQKEEKSWLASWFGPKEEPAPKSVKEWMKRNKQMRLSEPEDAGK